MGSGPVQDQFGERLVDGDDHARQAGEDASSSGFVGDQPGGVLADVPPPGDGPGDPMLAHQTDERVDIVALERAAELFARLPSAMTAR